MQFTHVNESNWQTKRLMYTIHVTQEDIDKARRLQSIRGTNTHCPIAFAIKRSGRFKDVHVFRNSIQIGDDWLINTHETSNYTHDFDQGYPIQPATLHAYIRFHERPFTNHA